MTDLVIQSAVSDGAMVAKQADEDVGHAVTVRLGWRAHCHAMRMRRMPGLYLHAGVQDAQPL